MSDAPSGENFYLRHDRYWVAPDEEADYPVRQGDLFADVEVAGERWPAALLIHPTCELPKVSVGRVQSRACICSTSLVTVASAPVSWRA